MPNSVGNGWLDERPWRLAWPKGREIVGTVAEWERSCCCNRGTPGSGLEESVPSAGCAFLVEGLGRVLSGTDGVEGVLGVKDPGSKREGQEGIGLRV